MKRLRSIPLAALTVILLLSLLAGCAGGDAKTQSKPSAAASASADVSASPAAAGERTITDMNGNQVTIPADIKKVYCSSPIGTYIVYTVSPDKLLGWNSKMSEDALQYIAEEYRDLPVLGGTMGGQNSINAEAITALAPDIILDFTYNHENSAMVIELSKQTGIPVVELSNALKDTPESYRLLGQILGKEQRGNELADYCQKTLDEVSAMVAKVPESEKVTIYYVESADGLATDGNDSMHTEVIKFLNATNVCSLDTSGSGKGTKVSMEQVVKWNPDVIIANAQMGGADFAKTVYSDSTWAGINAVKNHRIYIPASLPFNWFDRPPCIARVLGVEWLAYELYPQYVTVDLKSDVKTFYKTFYGVDITDEQADKLIGDTVAK